MLVWESRLSGVVASFVTSLGYDTIERALHHPEAHSKCREKGFMDQIEVRRQMAPFVCMHSGRKVCSN